MPRVRKEDAQRAETPQTALIEGALKSAEEKPEARKPGEMLTKADYKRMGLPKALPAMSDNDWSDKMLYVYRTAPYTINKTSRAAYGYIHKGQDITSREDVQDRFGGGSFRLVLNCLGEVFGEWRFTLQGEPRLLVDEELKGPPPQSQSAGQSGEETSKVVKMFLEERRREREEQGDEDAVEVLDNAITLMSKASEKAIEIAAGGRGNGSIGELTTAMKTMHEMIQPREQLSSKDVMELMLKMADKFARPAAANPETPADPVSQLETMLNVVDRLKERIEPVAAPGRDDWKANLITAGIQLVQNLPAILAQQRQAQMEQFQMMLAARAMQGPNAAGLSALPGMPPNPAMPDRAPAPTANPAAMAPPVADAFAEIKRHVVLMFKEGDEGSFVARMIQVVNPPLYKVLSAAPKDEILKFIAADAILHEIADSADLPAFVDEMVQYFADEAKSPAEEEAAPVVQ